jgi:hypothetical protein
MLFSTISGGFMKNITRNTLLLVSAVTLVWFWGACGGGGTPPEITSNATGKIYTTDSISVTFSELMDQPSVEEAFSITGSDPVPGTFSWADNMLTFTRESELWKTHHQYTLTITTDAKTSGGTPLNEDYVQTFTPQLNMHDVNGDGIDDFLLGAPGHDFSGKTDSGMVYLFLGKTEWSNVDLSIQSADATYTLVTDNARAGFSERVVGDINGDGFADIVFAGNNYIGIVYGSEAPSSIAIEFDPTDPATFDALKVLDGLAMNPTDVVLIGFPVAPAGDVNGDGLADFIIAAKYGTAPDYDARYWLVLGRTDGFPEPTTDLATMPTADTIANAVYTVLGDIAIVGMPFAACDINGDEFDDLVFASPEADVGGVTGVGEALVVAGTESPGNRDLRTDVADMTVSGEGENNVLGLALGCGDVNQDGYGDMLLSAPGYNMLIGRVYLVPGGPTFADVDLATTPAQAAYTGNGEQYFGLSVNVLGDVNADGIDDFMIGTPLAMLGGSQRRGQAFLFFGSQTPSDVDLGAGGVADATYLGPIPPNAVPPGDFSLLGVSKPIGDVNGDGVNDIAISAPMASEGGVVERGIVYLMFGASAPPSIDFSAGSADVTFLGAGGEDLLSMILPLF